MTDIGAKLSAYLDGELSDSDAAKVEALLEIDEDARGELESLMEANAFAMEEFEAMLAEPAPLGLYRVINNADEDQAELPEVAQSATVTQMPAPRKQLPVWASMAAAVALLVSGGAGGYVAGQFQPVVAPQQVAVAGWLQEISQYHAVYSKQTRHLVEVAATDSDHIEAWLGKTVGSQFSIPDLADHDLTFQGGRLLVAAGKPVAQLLYTSSDGVVVALCVKAAGVGQKDGFENLNFDESQMVAWRQGGADYVIVGPTDATDLDDIAQDASTQV